MTSEERCAKTDLITTMCAHCLGHTDIGGTAAVIAEGRPFTAQWHGTCVGSCDRPVEPGDPIVHVQDSSGYAHAECAT